MEQFPPNSQKARATEPREKIEPVTSATTRQRNNGLGRKFRKTFFAGSGKDVLETMVEEVVIPAIRELMHNAMQSGIDRMIYGERHRPSRHGYRTPWSGQQSGNVNYNGMSNPDKPQRSLSRQSRAHFDFDEIVIPSLQEANAVLDGMFDILSKYGEVSVAHLYALSDIRADHTDWKWGWTNLKGARAIGVRRAGGYLLDLPAPQELG